MTTKINLTCRMCGRIVTIAVEDREIRNWRNGMLIQYAFPNLTSAEREMLISHICSACFDKMFREDLIDE